MIGYRAAWLRPIVLAVIVGVLGMHAMVVVPVERPMAAPSGGHSMATPAMPSHMPPAMDQPATAAAVRADVLGPRQPHGGHDSTHTVLHLCLAIVAALFVLLVGLGRAAIGIPSDGADRANFGATRREPPRRPPPTSVRLAELCVMRN